ncbi:hypothetical protein R1flu_004940 [Riccia fluitans]|uniref:Uncharacterized protein n=1 Tax=Riccia fluitans TaxID=41844 RepID=A0ABD1YRR2_9MARC
MVGEVAQNSLSLLSTAVAAGAHLNDGAFVFENRWQLTQLIEFKNWSKNRTRTISMSHLKSYSRLISPPWIVFGIYIFLLLCSVLAGSCQEVMLLFVFSVRRDEQYQGRKDVLFLSGKGGHGHGRSHDMRRQLPDCTSSSPCATTLPVFLAVGDYSTSVLLLAFGVLPVSTLAVLRP